MVNINIYLYVKLFLKIFIIFKMYFILSLKQ